ncbi:MAG: HDIG domain-containing protein [Candidatus Doudnabacteria bacterium]
MTRAEAAEILDSYVDNPSLKKHMYSVEAAMRFYALKFGNDVEQWGIAGLLHDADWQKFPEQHPKVILEDLKKRGVDSETIHAISCHGKIFGVERLTQFDNALFACDEITGLVMTTALVRPDKLDAMEAKSVLKKMKDKGFAAGVSRDDVREGAESLGISLEEHIQNVIGAMQGIKGELGFDK